MGKINMYLKDCLIKVISKISTTGVSFLKVVEVFYH